MHMLMDTSTTTTTTVESSNSSPSAPVRGSKRRRLQGACDACRKRKIRCDRANMPNECSNCIAFNIPCTQTMGKTTKRAHDYNKSGSPSQDSLETIRLRDRIKKLERLLTHAQLDFDHSDGLSDRSGSQPRSPVFDTHLHPSQHHSQYSQHQHSSQHSQHPDPPSLISTLLTEPDRYLSHTSTQTLQRDLLTLARYAQSLENEPLAYLKEHLQPYSSPESKTKGTVGEEFPKNPRNHYGMRALFEGEVGVGNNCSGGGGGDDDSDASVNGRCGALDPLGGVATECETERDLFGGGGGRRRQEVDRLASQMQHLGVNPTGRKFFGKSSELVLIDDTFRLKSEVIGAKEPDRQPPTRRPVFWKPLSVSSPEIEQPVLEFPDDDLMYSLVNLYFDRMNALIPLLHKPTFFKNMANGLHKEDIMFGGLVLAACALGAAVGSDDPRTVADDAPLPSARGLEYARQIWLIRKPLMGSSSLHEVQLVCTILQVSYAGEGIYGMVGSALRFMQGLGVHRMNGTLRNSVDGEMWRRAFWAFVCMDRIVCSFTGRPCCVADEDYDLEWPTECDDEYWEDPVNPFVQPAGKPSKVQHFTQFIKLCIILGNTQRTIYANKKPRIFMNAKDDDWQRRVIMQLDSELNKWSDALPPHLRWNPYEENPLKLEQSGTLHAYQHFIRISIHRPFISSDDDSAVPLPLLISTNAGRALCQILYTLRERGISPVPYVQAAGFVSGVILLLNLWASIRHNRDVEWDKEMSYVDKCMSVMKYAELRWCTAGRFWDILNQLRWIPMDENHVPPLVQSYDSQLDQHNVLPPIKIHPASFATSESSNNTAPSSTAAGGGASASASSLSRSSSTLQMHPSQGGHAPSSSHTSLGSMSQSHSQPLSHPHSFTKPQSHSQTQPHSHGRSHSHSGYLPPMEASTSSSAPSSSSMAVSSLLGGMQDHGRSMNLAGVGYHHGHGQAHHHQQPQQQPQQQSHHLPAPVHGRGSVSPMPLHYQHGNHSQGHLQSQQQQQYQSQQTQFHHAHSQNPSPNVHAALHLPPLQGGLGGVGTGQHQHQFGDAGYLDAYPGYEELPSSFGGLDESQLLHASQNLASTYSFANCESSPPVSLQDMMTMVMDSSNNYAPSDRLMQAFYSGRPG